MFHSLITENKASLLLYAAGNIQDIHSIITCSFQALPHQKMTAQTAMLQQQISLLQDELANEKAKVQMLEQKVCDFQLQVERVSIAKQKVHTDQLEAAAQQLKNEKSHASQLEEVISQLSDFANNRTTLTRQLEIARAQLDQARERLEQQRDDFFAQLAHQRAQASEELEKATAEAYHRGFQDAEEQQLLDCHLLREQNRGLQRSIKVLKEQAPSLGFAKSMGDSSGASPRGSFAAPDASMEAQLQRELFARGQQNAKLQGELARLKEERAKDSAKQAQFMKDLLLKHEQERRQFRNQIVVLERFAHCKLLELYRVRTLAAAVLQRRTTLENTLYAFLAEAGLSEEQAKNLPKTFKEMQAQVTQSVKPKQNVPIGSREIVLGWLQRLDQGAG